MPSTMNPRMAAASWRAGPSDIFLEKEEQPLARTISEGSISWLPERNQMPVNFALRCKKTGVMMADGGHNHPILVLSVKQRPGSREQGDQIVTFAMVTTFRDTALPEYLSGHNKKTGNRFPPSIPILGRDVARSSDEFLYFEDSHLRKQSYVRLGNAYDIPVSYVNTATVLLQSDLRLERSSYEVLMRRLRLESDVCPTTTIWRASNRRLRAPAAGELQNACSCESDVFSARSQQAPTRTSGPAHQRYNSNLQSWRARGRAVPETAGRTCLWT